MRSTSFVSLTLRLNAPSSLPVSYTHLVYKRQEFGIAFYDKELIKLASEESGLCKEFFEKADEKESKKNKYLGFKIDER